MSIEPPLDPTALAVFAALGAVVFAATLRRPADAVVALLATGPFAFGHSVGPTTITFGKVALVAAALALALSRPSLRIFRERAPYGLLLALAAVVVATALSAIPAVDRGAVLRETLKAVQYLATFVVAAIAWSLDPDRRRLRVALLATVAVVAAVALSQEISGAPSGIWYAGKAYPRIAGPLEGPNQLAGYLGIVLPFVAIFAIERISAPALVTATLGSAALILTLSRAGLFAGLLALAIVLRYRRSHLAWLGGALAAGALAAAAVLIGWHVSDVGSRFISFGEVEHAGGVGTRSVLWRAALARWERHPILGVGAGNFELLLPSVAPAGIKTHANSWYLQSLVEGGIPLLLATLGLVWA
ncbi:MAG: O-antigen ligase family protein, partial [Candidatus Eremiobacteraeota bacterium]|nr:O-antigen ligase family protein [Candidatus Eremiobacteraeota bacterium]